MAQYLRYRVKDATGRRHHDLEELVQVAVVAVAAAGVDDDALYAIKGLNRELQISGACPTSASRSCAPMSRSTATATGAA